MRLIGSTFFPYTTLFRSAVSRCLLPGGCSRFVGSLQPVIAPWADVTARARAQPGMSAPPPDREQGLLLTARGGSRTRLGWVARSEEHTSELQARGQPACRPR